MLKEKTKLELQDIKNLSELQRKLLLIMEKKNCYLVHEEGSNFKCWLESKTGKSKIPIRKDTANKLFKIKAIAYSNEITMKKIKNPKVYYHVLTDRYLLGLEYLRRTKEIKW